MRGESQVEVAFLILLTAAYCSEFDVNSELIGEAAGCNPVVVRRLYKKLKDADLLDTKPGRYGLHLTRDPRSINLLEVVEAVRPLDTARVFGVERPLSGTTPVSDELFGALGAKLGAAVDDLKESLRGMTLQDLAEEIHLYSTDPIDVKNQQIHRYMVDAEKRYSDEPGEAPAR